MIAPRSIAVPTRPRGFVLIVVLWAVAIVTIIALGFGRRAVLDTTAATYSVDYAQALMEARGAAERGIVEVQNSMIMNQIQAAGRLYTYLGQPWARPGDLYKDDAYFNKKNHGKNDTATYTIIDADRFANINMADDEHETLLKNLKIKPGILRKIHHRLRELKKDEEPQPFAELEELRYLEGVDEEDWFGDEKHPGLKDVLTVVGSSRINVNTAPEAVLKAIPGLKGDAAKRIVAYRNGDDGKPGTDDDRGFVDLGDLRKQLEIETGADELAKYCSVNSTCFIITGAATRQGGKVRASCTVTVNISPGGPPNIAGWKEEPFGA